MYGMPNRMNVMNSEPALSENCLISRMKEKMISKEMGIKNSINSAMNIPNQYEIEFIPAKFKRYLNLSSLSFTDVRMNAPCENAIPANTRNGNALPTTCCVILFLAAPEGSFLAIIF